MDLMLKVPPVHISQKISYDQQLLLIGSCFTEHIGDSLQASKFKMLQNPNGIIYNPVSICNNLLSYITPYLYEPADIFEINGTWQSWQHHSRCGGMDKEEVLDRLNTSQRYTHDFLKKTDWLVLTFGTSFIYQLNETQTGRLTTVANCHKAPGKWFQKKLLSVADIVTAMDNCMHQLFHFNPKLKILFTISPVRHIRDGLVENTLSKARLFEAVHHMVNKFDRLYYYPAYELVNDVLRDYRFYETDMVHPNKQATNFVFEHFINAMLDQDSQVLYQRVNALVAASNHKPFQPQTQSHKDFLNKHLHEAQALQEAYKHLDFSKEIAYFSSAMDNL